MNRVLAFLLFTAIIPFESICQETFFQDQQIIEHRITICELNLDSSIGDTLIKEQIFFTNSKGDTLLDCDIYTFGRIGTIYVWYGYSDREINMLGLHALMLDTNGNMSIKISHDHVKDLSYWFNIKKEAQENFKAESDDPFEKINRLLNHSVVKQNRMVCFRRVYDK